MYVLIFSVTFFWKKHLSFQQELSKMWSNMYIGLHVKHQLFFLDLNETWIFLRGFWKILKYKNFKKIHLVGAGLFHADRWTEMTKLTVIFHNFTNTPKREQTWQ